MRYAWVVRVAVVTAMTVIAAVNVVPLPPQLQAVVVGGVAIGLLIWAEVDRRASLRDSPMFHAHVKDLQGFAAAVANMISGSPYSVDLASGLGPWFCSHFPKLCQRLDEWNSLISEVESSDAKVRRLIADQRRELALPDGSAFDAVPNGIVKSGVDPAQLEWGEENNWIVARQGDSSSFWQIAPAPPNETTRVHFVARLREAIQKLAVDPDLTTYRGQYNRIPKLRKSLVEDLNLAAHIQQPPGHCAGCPK